MAPGQASPVAQEGELPNDPTIQFPLACFDSARYFRIEYLQWSTQDKGQNVESNHGALYALGWTRRFDAERVRLEFFGGDTTWAGFDANAGWLTSDVETLGFRGEYEYCWPIFGAPPHHFDFLMGIGTQVWLRDIKDAAASDGSIYQIWEETWWTIYPYIGLERRRILANGWTVLQRQGRLYAVDV